ncbi:uncharacterized protein LOC119961442 [Scyliorhinus canicula]|uniref:uncharacterized protein LOC119961442 n=1 Tax=Scyliorhinus canicula TaxID=7830 RepID=UPI0018F4771D|nr:uncharacterized protein LOC119961442 [Scyliorhinus canicula]
MLMNNWTASNQLSSVRTDRKAEKGHGKSNWTGKSKIDEFQTITAASTAGGKGVGCLSQSVTQRPAAVTSEECQTLTITCVLNGYYYYLKNGDFFKQTHSVADWERISSGGRFIVSVNEAEKTFSLEIRDVRVEDSATYYCKAQYRDDTYGYMDGSGTLVTITAGNSLVSKNPPLQTSAPGDTVTLNWEYSGFCQYTVHWYRQSPGQAPEFLLQRHTTGEENKGKAAGGNIAAPIDHVKKISRIKITEIQLSDSAVYYCALSRHTEQ